MDFSTQMEEVSATRRKFKISVPKEQVKKAFDHAAGEIQKSANIRGFRPGKVPTNLVRKFFVEDLTKKAYEQVIEDSYQKTIQGTDLQIVSYPQIEPAGQFQENNEFSYTATVDINPKVDIKGYKELKLDLKKADISDADVNAELEALGRAIGSFETSSAKAAASGHFAKMSFEGSIDGKPFPGGTAKDQRIELGKSRLIPDFENAVIGMKPGETKEASVTFPKDYFEKDLQGKSALFKITLHSIDELKIPAQDDAFAKKFGVNTMEDLKKALHSEISKNKEEKNQQAYQEQIIDQILEKNDFAVPESLVDNTIDRAVELANSRLAKEQRLDPKNEEVRSRYRDWALKQVRGILALGHVAREEKISVNEEELRPHLIQAAYSMNMTPNDMIRKGGYQVIEEVRGRVLMSKTVQHLVTLNSK